jgi:hypothetical protein
MGHVYHPTLQVLTIDASIGCIGCPVSLVTQPELILTGTYTSRQEPSRRLCAEYPRHHGAPSARPPPGSEGV